LGPKPPSSGLVTDWDGLDACLDAAKREQWDLSFAGVFRISADLGTITVLVDDFLTPNGLAFSPDEASSTSTIRDAAISALSMSRRTARWRGRPTGCSPT
jgi:hypothetical protein